MSTHALDHRLDDLASTLSSANTRLTELEKRQAREPDYANDNTPSADGALAAAIAASSDAQALTSSFQSKAVVQLIGERAAITSANTTVGAGRSTSTSLVPSQRLAEIVVPYQRALTIRDLIPSATTTSNAIEWPRETGFTNAAAPVAEGATKPYSDLTFDLVSSPVRTLAHLFKISRQMLDDGPAMAAYIQRRGTYGLKFVEENQLLNGLGTGQNLRGILPQATTYQTSRNKAGFQALDILNAAISQAEESDLPVSGIVLSKADWRAIVGLKDTTGNYISDQSPFGTTAPRLWNLPVVATNAMVTGQFLLGGFQEGAQIFDRLEVEVLISSENDRDWELNLATVRIEERLALATLRPDAFVTGSLIPA